MSKSHLLKYLLISPNLPVGGFCYSEGLESYLNTKDLKDSNSVKELIISELEIGQIRLDARLLLNFYDIFNEINDRKNIKSNIEKIFKVNVTKVNIINKQSRTKLTRGRKVKVSGFKKAIITLKKGQSIDLTTGI